MCRALKSVFGLSLAVVFVTLRISSAHAQGGGESALFLEFLFGDEKTVIDTRTPLFTRTNWVSLWVEGSDRTLNARIVYDPPGNISGLVAPSGILLEETVGAFSYIDIRLEPVSP